MENTQRLLRTIERRFPDAKPFTTEKSLRFDHISGLDAEQLDKLEYRVNVLLEEPWDKEERRPRELTLREALVAAADICGRTPSRMCGQILRRRPVNDIAVNHIPHAIC